MMPLAYSFLGVIPIKATLEEALYYFLPFYLVQLIAFSWLNHRSRSAILSEVYSLVLVFPLALTVIQVMLNPFSKGFKVTPKGTANKHYTFNWNLAFPLIVLFVTTAISLWRNLGMCLSLLWQQTNTPEVIQHFKGLDLGWIWSGYNLVLLSISVLILWDAPKADIYEWFDLRRVVRLNIKKQNQQNQQNQNIWGVTTMISEVGAEIALTQQPPQDLAQMQSINLEIAEENLQLDAQIIQTGSKDEFSTVRVKFALVSVEQHRRLVKMLFCRPGQWKGRCTPGEWQSLLILFKILIKPRVLFERKLDVSATVVSKT